MTPVFVAMVVVLFDRVRRLDASPALGQATRRRTTAAVCLLLLAMSVVAQARFVIDAETHGLSFTSRTWKRSPGIARARDLPAGAPIYSNRPDAVRYLAVRPASGVPLECDFHTLCTNPAYASELASLGARLLAGQAYLVSFPTDVWFEQYVPSRTEIEGGLGLPAMHRETDGSIHGRPHR